jgi:hypothetical protein
MRGVVAAIAPISTSGALSTMLSPVTVVPQRVAVPRELQRFANRDILARTLRGRRLVQHR